MDCISVGASNLESLRRDYARLERDLGAIEDRLDNVQDPVEEVRLRERKKETLSNITQIEHQIEICEAGSKSYQFRQVTTHWDEHLHKIDHAKSKNTTATILKRIENSPSRSSLFLFQRYEKFLGKRYVEHLKKAIDGSDMGHFSQPYRIGLLDRQPTSMEFLNNLGEQLKVEISSSQEVSVELIVERIKTVLKGCNIFFIEVNLPHLDGNCEFVCWFIEEFWGKVIDRIPEFLAENQSALFIGVVTLESALERDILKQQSCKPADFTQGKFVVLHEEKWKEEDIRNWMRKFSRLPLSLDQLEKIPRYIWDAADGLPFATEVKLLQELEKLAG